MFQVFEKQDEPLNERSYYVGTVYDESAIGFVDCGLWVVTATSARSVKLILSEHLLYKVMFLRSISIFNTELSNFYHVNFCPTH